MASFFCAFGWQRSTDNGQQTLGIHCLNSVTKALRSFASLREYFVVPSALWFIGNILLQAFRTACSIPAWELSLLRSFFFKLKTENGKLKINFQLSIFNFQFSIHRVALGIAAASFAKLGLQTSDYGLRFFLSEEKIKASKDIAESPTA